MAQIEHGRYLMDHPQRLGILPTWWFWSDRKNWRPVRWPFAIAAAAMVLALAVVSLPPALEFGILMTAYFLALGSVEKYIRHQALKRRALAGAEAPDALPEQRQH
ncbi:MAG: hypothetical protein R6X02_13095 [Enhygromyxa sp.]